MPMGHNDHLEDDRPELPSDAGEHGRRGFEPDDAWLENAPPELQCEAMRLWFLSRYCDPAEETPYMSSEGGYLYIHGGPYHADEELPSRFEGVVDDELIDAVVEDIESGGLYDWAPIHTEPAYDPEFDLQISAREVPYTSFRERLNEVELLANAKIDERHNQLIHQLLYSHLIGALEAYLAESMSYWISTEPGVLERFVRNCNEFRKQKLCVSDIFDRLESLEGEVNNHLQKIVWHRLDMVMPLFCKSLGINKPVISDLMQAIIMRHDIVHRAGRTKGGDVLHIDADTLHQLQANVLSFVNEIEEQISRRFPQ